MAKREQLGAEGLKEQQPGKAHPPVRVQAAI